MTKEAYVNPLKARLYWVSLFRDPCEYPVKIFADLDHLCKFLNREKKTASGALKKMRSPSGWNVGGVNGYLVRSVVIDVLSPEEAVELGLRHAKPKRRSFGRKFDFVTPEREQLFQKQFNSRLQAILGLLKEANPQTT